MNVNKLSFYNGYGNPLNLSYDITNDKWTGTYYFEEISVSLFDTVNIIFAEILNDKLGYPNLSVNDNLTFKLQDDSVFFLYKISKDDELKLHYIDKLKIVDINYSDVLNNSRLPIQINVAFNPIDDIGVETVLIGELNGVVFLELKLYGVGVVEDVRFDRWLYNFGIKFHKNDAQILKDYELEEVNPDWKLINTKRKELVVNKEEIIPYIGSYKGLMNMLKLFGYSDVLDVKEYLVKKDINNPEYSDYTLFSITDLLNYGIADVYNKTLDSVVTDTEEMHKIYKKSGFLALSYKFTDTNGEYDDIGLPEVVSTGDDDPDEVFYKLYKLKDMLEVDYLPTNLVIKDIIGEYIYFNSVIIKNWSDDTKITNFSANQNLTVNIFPEYNFGIVDLKIFNIKHYDNGLSIPVESINDTGIDFLSKIDNQKWNGNDNIELAGVIEKYYKEYVNSDLDSIGVSEKYNSNDSDSIIGCPVVFKLEFEQLPVSAFGDVLLDDLDGYYTCYNIYNLNIFEIEWFIKRQEGGYNFNIRGSVDDFQILSHFLTKVGTYDVEVLGYDFMGNVSNSWHTSITVVYENNPTIYSVVKISDKVSNKLLDLNNILVEDFHNASFREYYANVLKRFDKNNDKLLKEYDLYWYNIQNDINKYQIYNELTQSYESYSSSSNKYKDSLGVYDDTNALFFDDIPLTELEYMSADTYNFIGDYIPNWWFKNPVAGEEIVFNRRVRYTIPTFTDLDDLVDKLNNESSGVISKYNYFVDENDVIKAISDEYDKLLFIGYGGTISNGMVLHYMNSVIGYDDVYYDYFGKYNGKLNSINDSGGYFDNDVHFNGITSYIKTKIDHIFSDKLSLFFEMRFDSDYDDGSHTIFSSYDNGYFIRLMFDVSGGAMTSDGLYVVIDDNYEVKSNVVMAFNDIIHHIFLLIDGNDLKLYDGTTLLADDNNILDVNYSNFVNLILGNNDLLYLYDVIGFKGYLYAFTIWDRILTSTEMDAIITAYDSELSGGNVVELSKLLIGSESIETSEFNFSYPHIFKENYVNNLSSLFPAFKKEMLMVDVPFIDIITGKVNDVLYWERNGYFYSDGNEIIGNLPSLHVDDYYKKDKIKVFGDGYVMLKYIPNLFIVTNISSKHQYIWTLRNENKGEDIITVRNVPYLLWTFKYEGIYSVSVRVLDSKGNEHYKLKNNFIKVVDVSDYKNHIESKLNLMNK